ncbi:MAG: hypothetical protein RLZZ67_2 [Candidatus Parcubacteria bacterium]|jgi:uncharacterized membrane protein (UPF0127 family)
MKTRILILVGVFVLGLSLVLYKNVHAPVEVVGESLVRDVQKRTEVSLNGTTFSAYVSDTEKLRENGLSGFKGLSDKELMLFKFDNDDTVGFWMKDMLFSIDIVWVDSAMKVISIEKNVSPATFPKVFYPAKPSRYVLELAAGITERIGTKIGDTLTISGGK